MLENTHKNSEVFKMFSDKLAECGFNRSVEQCRIKVKKLRQQYIKVRDVLRRSGSSGDEKEKFLWYDEMDQILGTRPTSNPVNIIDSFEESTETTTDEYSELNDTDKSSTADNEELGGAGSPEDTGESMQEQAIPRIHGRKRKANSDRLDLQTFLHHQRELLKEFQESEHNLQQHEMEAFEKCMKASQEAEERRFQALQAQQQATNNMFFQLMGSLISAVGQEKSKGPPQSYLSPPPGGPVMPTPSVSVPQSSSTQVNLQPQEYIPVDQQPVCEMMQPPMYHQQSQNDGEQPLSSLLHEANSTQHFFNL